MVLILCEESFDRIYKINRIAFEKIRFLAKIDTSYATKEIGFLMPNDLFSVESYYGVVFFL